MNVKDPLSPGTRVIECVVLYTRGLNFWAAHLLPLFPRIYYIYIYIQSTRIAVEIVATMMGALLHAPDNNCSLSIFVIIHAYYVEEGSETRLLLGRCTKERRWASFPFCQELAAKLKLWPKSGVKRGGRRGGEEWKEEWRERMERERNIAKESCQNSFSNDGIRSLPWKFVFFSLIRVSNLFFFIIVSN